MVVACDTINHTPKPKGSIAVANDTQITLVGNLTQEPELRFTPSGAAVANFTVASTPRSFDKTTQEWRDGEALFLRCSVWREAAENVAETLTRGMRVVVTGRLKQRSYETKEGEKRTVVELDVDEVGPSLRYASAKVTKTARRSDAPAPAAVGQAGPDPWATTPQTARPSSPTVADVAIAAASMSYDAKGWGNAPAYDEPPAF